MKIVVLRGFRWKRAFYIETTTALSIIYLIFNRFILSKNTLNKFEIDWVQILRFDIVCNIIDLSIDIIIIEVDAIFFRRNLIMIKDQIFFFKQVIRVY
jgi:hypothetical protein